MEREHLEALGRQVGTPAYVFDTDCFRARAELVKDAFGPRTGLCFSIKANPFLLKELPEVFDRIEVCSPGELTICEKTGMDMGKVIFSGVNKTEADVERAMEDGVGVFTAESRLHLELINAAALRRGRRVPLLLRLTAGSQFGMEGEELLSIIDRRGEYPGVEIVGLHFFSGTQKRKAAAVEKELDRLLDFMDRVEQEHGFRLERLEYGTGLAADYFSPSNAQALEEERLEAVAGKVRQVAEKIDLTVEMGRFFAAPCGAYFTRVMDVKTNGGVHYAILDGGLNQLHYDGQLLGMQTPGIVQLKGNGSLPRGEAGPWTLCGSLCTTGDILAKNVPFPGLEIGDILVFERTGAYSVMEGMALFLSRELPEVFTYSKRAGLVRRRGRMGTDPFNTPENLSL